MRTPFETRMELAGNVLAEFITHEIHTDVESEELEINVDDYWHDLQPHVIQALKDKWEEDLKILTNESDLTQPY